jgi:hypothetical protein
VPAAVNWPTWFPWTSVSASTPPAPPPAAPLPARTLPDGSQAYADVPSEAIVPVEPTYENAYPPPDAGVSAVSRPSPS